MSLLSLARAYYRRQRRLARASQEAARVAWRRMRIGDLDLSWAEIGAQVETTVSGGQLLAAQAAQAYIAAAMAEQLAPDVPSFDLIPGSLAGIASDGRALGSLLYSSVIEVKQALSVPAAVPAEAMARGEAALIRIVGTQVQDSGRAATDVAMTVRPQVRSWVRILDPPSCSRCVILAGRVYRWSDGFLRHPLCDCVMAPSVEDAAGDLRTDPRAYFDSLSRADKDKYFTKAGAQAILEGANMNQVVNARRGAAGLSRPGRLTKAEQRMLRNGKDRGELQRVDVYGRRVFSTSEGTTVRGLAGQRLAQTGGAAKQPGTRYRVAKTPRLMPEAIADLAGDDRDERIRLLRRFGYIV